MDIRKFYVKYMHIYLTLMVFFAALKFIYIETPLDLLVKFYFITSFFICFIYSLFYKLLIFKETKLFIVFSIIPAIIGLIKYGITSEYLSHMFAVVLPIFAISFGFKIGKYINEKDNINIINKVFSLSYYLNILIIILFQIAFGLGYVRYPAVAPTGLILSSLYFLSNGKFKKYIIGIIFIIISGKRASLVMVILPLLIYGLDYMRGNQENIKKLKKIFKWVVIILFGCIPTIIYLWNRTRFLNRIKLIFKFKLNDEYAMYVATGGRSEEIINIIKFLNENPLRYFFGAGFGSKVEIFQDFYRHYSHFSPLSYTLVFGIVFSIIIYFIFSCKLFKKTDINEKLYFTKLIFSSYFFSSFFGAIVMNDVNFWIFYGMLIFFISLLRNKKMIFEKGDDL